MKKQESMPDHAYVGGCGIDPTDPASCPACGRRLADCDVQPCNEVGWVWRHEHEGALIARDGWMCEQHPGREWPHDDCAGPGMPWCVEGKAAVTAFVSPEAEGSARSDEYWLAMAALDNYPIDDGLPKSTAVVYRIHQLGRAFAAAEVRLTAQAQEIARLTARAEAAEQRLADLTASATAWLENARHLGGCRHGRALLPVKCECGATMHEDYYGGALWCDASVHDHVLFVSSTKFPRSPCTCGLSDLQVLLAAHPFSLRSPEGPQTPESR